MAKKETGKGKKKNKNRSEGGGGVRKARAKDCGLGRGRGARGGAVVSKVSEKRQVARAGARAEERTFSKWDGGEESSFGMGKALDTMRK